MSQPFYKKTTTGLPAGRRPAVPRSQARANATEHRRGGAGSEEGPHSGVRDHRRPKVRHDAAVRVPQPAPLGRARAAKGEPFFRLGVAFAALERQEAAGVL